jgi:hypothetical protein
MAHVKARSGLAQAMQPGPQQGRGLHLPGKHPAGTADEGFHAQFMGPGAQVVRAEGVEQGFERLPAFAVAGQEAFPGLGMGQVESAAPGQQELAAQGRHAVVEIDPGATPGQDFRRHQPGRAAADHHDATRGREARHCFPLYQRGPRGIGR